MSKIWNLEKLINFSLYVKNTLISEKKNLLNLR